MFGRRNKRKLSYKEEAEQALLKAVDEAHEQDSKSAEEAKKPTPSTSTKTVQASKTAPKTVVYIDGENLFWHLFDSLKKQRVIRGRYDLIKLDLKWLLDQVLKPKNGLEYRYYGTKLREEKSDEKLLKRSQKMIDHKRRWVGYISQQGIDFISAGELKIRDKSEKGQESDLTFAEKGVDVRLATDMIEDALTGKSKAAVLISSDRDLQPAIVAMTRNDKKVVYVGFEGRTNDQMTGSADRSLTITNQLIKEAYKRSNK